MKEQGRLMPWEILSPIERGQILALYCVACQGFLREEFWRSETHLSTDTVSQLHQAKFGREHYSYLAPTGYVFNPKMK